MLAAEAGAQNKQFDIAREACHEFFLDGASTRDQFFCRALFVKVSIRMMAFIKKHVPNRSS